MSTTIQKTDLETIAAAGLGRKAKTAHETMQGTAVGFATDGETWVEVVGDAAPDAGPGRVGDVDAAPVCASITAGATIGGRDFRRIVAGIVPATDTESSRYALGGVLLEVAEGSMLAAVATDGRRLHVGHVQPTTIHGQAAPIVRSEHWQALAAAVRAAVRKLCGASGRRLDAVIDRGTLSILVGSHKPTGGEVVVMTWESSTDDGHGRPVVVRAAALAVAGRFPRWRDCFPRGGQTLTINVDRVADALAEYDPIYRAAEKAGKAAWKLEQEEKKRRRQSSGGQYRHSIGVDCHSAGMIGRGAEWSSVVVATPVAVKLDHRYLADALAGAAAWGASTANVGGTDGISAVTLRTAEHGPRFEAVIMPLAMD
jgi:hypothetical protein